MLFAIADYIKYKLQMGMYSMKAMEQKYPSNRTMKARDCTNICKPGDILLVHTADSLLSWLVMYYTGPTIWSHVATFGNQGFIYDATINGVMKHHVTDYINERSFVVVRQLLGVSDDKRAEMEECLDETAQRNCRFNWKGVLRLWLLIVFGAHRCFRFRYLCDFLILVSGVLALTRGVRAFFWAVLGLGLLYCLVAFTNCGLRISKGEEFPRF